MNSRKILLGILISLLMIQYISAEPTFALDDNQFGNIRYGSVQANSPISIGLATNRTACFPIVAGTSGYFDSFDLEFDTKNSASFKFWIDNEITFNFSTADVHGYWNGSGEFYFETDELLQYENQFVSKGEFFYFCIQATDTLSNSISGYKINQEATSYYPDYRMVSVAQPLFLDNQNPVLIQHPNGTIYNSSLQFNDLGLGFVQYSTADEIPQSFQICYRPSFFSGEDYCYSYSSYEGSQHLFGLDTDGANTWVGQYFTYNFDDGYAESIDLYMYGSTTTSGAETLTFKLWTLDADTFPAKQLLVEETGIALSGVAQENSTLLNIPFSSSAFLETDKEYMFEVSCVSGCTGGTDKYLLSKGYLYPNSYYKEGFQDTIGHGFENNSGVITNLSVDAIFVLNFASDIVPTEPGAGNLSNCTTTCTTWSGSSYLKEDFIGNLIECDWAVNSQYCWLGSMIFDKTDPYYTIFKNTDLKYSTDSRYYTVSFDFRPADIDTDGYVSLSLYDYDYVRYINVLFGAGGVLYNNEEGDAVETYSNMSTSTVKNVQLHVDLTNDDFDLYYDDVKVVSGLQFVNSFYNMDSIYGLRVSSQDAGYQFENLEIYATNQDNVRTVLDEGGVDILPDETKTWCELFSKETVTCSVDSDCESGDCLPTGHCAKFDFTWCDENGHTRGNGCVISAMTTCVLESTGDIILDNFFLFLVFLVILMGLVYVFIMFKN